MLNTQGFEKQSLGRQPRRTALWNAPHIPSYVSIFKRCATQDHGLRRRFLLVVIGIRWFQRDVEYALWHPVRLLGYYATFAILYGTSYAIIGRLKRSKTVYAHSHSSDWAFLILLWLTAFTGIVIHATRLLEMPLTTYAMYVLHLMIAVPMLILEVPFAKWTHQLYRPLVVYLMKVKERALQGA